MSHTHSLEPQNVLRPSDGSTSRVSEAFIDTNLYEVSMSMSREAFQMLHGLAASSGQPLDDVIGKAFLLYKASIEAQRDGKAVGIAPSAEVLETEFVGL
jgi:hypothetical protein